MTANSLPPHDDEIDRTAPLLVLWRGRKVVAYTALVGLLAAFTYLMNTPPRWVSSATIAPPSYEQMGNYYLTKSQLDALPLFSQNRLRVPARPTEDEQSKEVLGLSEQLFETTKLLLETTPNITLLRPDGKKQQLFQVQASGTTPAEAQQNLTLGLSNVNLRLTESKKRELHSQMTLLQSALLSEQQNLARQAHAKRTQELAALRQVLNSAKRAGLVHFAGSNYAGLEQSGMQYLLGSKLLQGKLTSLEQTTPEYSARYYEISTLLVEMKQLATNQAIKVQGFQQLSTPSLPNNPAGPNKFIISTLASIAGALIGCLFILTKELHPTLQAKLSNQVAA